MKSRIACVSFGMGSEFPLKNVVFIFVVILLVSSVVWVVSGISYYAMMPDNVALLVVPYTLGLRHALDADHIAAIDNVTRRLVLSGKRPVTVGLYFALGHSTVVLFATMLIATLSEQYDRPGPVTVPSPADIPRPRGLGQRTRTAVSDRGLGKRIRTEDSDRGLGRQTRRADTDREIGQRTRTEDSDRSEAVREARGQTGRTHRSGARRARALALLSGSSPEHPRSLGRRLALPAAARRRRAMAVPPWALAASIQRQAQAAREVVCGLFPREKRFPIWSKYFKFHEQLRKGSGCSASELAHP